MSARLLHGFIEQIGREHGGDFRKIAERQIVRALLCDLLHLRRGRAAAQKLLDGAFKQLRKLGELGNIGHGIAALPITHRLKTHAEPIGKRKLRHVAFLALARYDLSHFHGIEHDMPPFVLFFRYTTPRPEMQSSIA